MRDNATFHLRINVAKLRMWKSVLMANQTALVDFLSENGLLELLDIFSDQDIDMTVLPLLDKDDFKELGLTIGQRKKLLSALGTVQAQSNGIPTPARALDDAPIQLRRISVMFCDMIGSTQLSEQLSIEEMQSLLQHYYDVAHAVAQHRNGYVVGTLGDGVVILFGYPRVLDGFADHCVQAAQELQSALAKTSVVFEGQDPIYIATRIGIATGQAAVGQAGGGLPGDPMQLVGPVVNRAARLQAVAHPLSIAVDIKTQELTRNSVQYSEVEKHNLKGLPSGVEVFHVDGMQYDTVGLTAPTILIGRDAETDILRALWAQAQVGAPANVTITGDAGIGKSTLVQSFVATLSSHSARVLHLHCTAMAARSPLRPIAKVLSVLSKNAPQAQSLATLLGNPAPEMIECMTQFLGLSDNPSVSTAISLRDRDGILDLLSDWIIQDSSKPTVLVLENAQWADDSTRQLVNRTAKRAKSDGARLLILTTTREEAADIWTDQVEHKALTLLPLDSAQSETLLQSIFGCKPVPQSIRENILSHSGGNPLMLETLGRAQAQHHLAKVAGAVEIPHTIYESVSKRLDGIRLGRSVIEALAVLNRPVDQNLLSAVLKQENDSMRPAIDALEQAGLVSRKTLVEHEEISIRHQVYRDVIYEQIFGRSRRHLHAAAFSALCAFDPDIQTTRPDVLATHAHFAGDWERTSTFALHAGEALLKRSALIEAGYFLDMANVALQHLPVDQTTNKKRLRTITSLASIERSRFGIATDTSADLGQQAVQLAREIGDSKSELLALNGLYAHSLVRANYPLAQEYAQTLLDTAWRCQDKIFVMIGTRAIGAVAFHRADQQTAMHNLGTALEQYDKDTHFPLAHAHGYDHAEICSAFLSMSHWIIGDLQKGREYGAFSIAHSREIDHAHSLAQAMAFRVMWGALARDGAELAAIGLEAAELGEKFDIRVMRAAAVFFPFVTQLCLRPKPPKPSELIELTQKAKDFRAVNPYNYGPLVASLIADVSLRAGDLDAADKALCEGAEIEARTGETWTAPELLRMRARLAAERGNLGIAQQLRREALETALTAGALTLALRILCDTVEADPSPTNTRSLQDAYSQMTSDDQGWDMTRAATLVRTGILTQNIADMP
jgi:class 3 adenylate cyclase